MKTTGFCKAIFRYSTILVLVGTCRVMAAEAMKPELLSPVQQRMQQEISLDFKDTPIDDVLMIMAKQVDVDIIKSPKVTGTVTATLTDVPLAEALSSILEAHGHAYVTTDNIIRVVPKAEVFEVREKLVSRVFRITYANVKDVETALKQFISADVGAISSNPGTSNIIVTDTESKVKAINSFIEEIDRITPQILVSAQIYDVTSSDNLDLGVKWQAGTPTDFGQPTADQTWGNDFGTVGNIIGGITDTAIGSAFNSGINRADTEGLLRLGVLNDSVHVDAAIFAAQDDIRAKLLANPRVLVLDNEQAEIKIVEEVPYQQLTQSTDGGSVGTTEFRDVGVELRVTPHLTREGLIHLTLNPKFSTITGSVNIVEGGNNIPQPVVATRETITTALIKDQQTVVIGGLKKQDKIQETSKVPLLGDLPLLGELFKFHGESTVNSELVVFITPQIVVKPELSEEEQRYLADSEYVSPNLPKTRLGNGEE
ncbi:MAG: secretin N-terminal domain-containing protein [Planctomycetota bacterium]